MSYVTPYLPQAGIDTARNWARSGKQYFVKAFEQANGECRNCQGNGVVYLVLAESGPHGHPMVGKVLTWYDGDGQTRKGWYVIGDTLAFVCPECKGLRHETGEYVLPPKRPDADMKKLGERMRR
jgi:hypothetical protein